MINRVTLVGRLGGNPEVKHVNDTSVANFSMATSESYKDKNGDKKEVTDWHFIVAWRGLAEIAGKYLHKGDLVYIEGKLKTRSWDKDGEKRFITEVFADTIKMLGGKNESNKPSDYAPTHTEAPPMTAHEKAVAAGNGATDDLPF